MNCDRLKFVYIKSRFNEFYSMSYMQVYIYVLFIPIYFTNEKNIQVERYRKTKASTNLNPKRKGL